MFKQLRSNIQVGAAMATNRVLNTRRPISVQILVTKFCDMTCNMCFTYPIDSQEKFKNTAEPSFEQLEYLMDEACKIGAQVIIPFGGEPLIRKDIGKIVNGIKARNKYCVLYTNATYLKDRIDEIRATDQLVISIDGDEANHDSIRGKGSYKKCIEGIELAIEKGFVLRLHAVLTKDTLDTLPHMVSLSKKYNVMLNYGFTDATALTKPIKDQFVPSRTEVVTFLQGLLEAKLSGVKIATPMRVIKELIRVMKVWPIEGHTLSRQEAEKFKHLKIPKCGLFTSNIYIDSDGRAYPCLPLWGQEGHGPNVYEVGLQKAWDHYNSLNCYQCASVFTIEKGLFYNFELKHVLQFLDGFEFLRPKPKSLIPVKTNA